MRAATTIGGLPAEVERAPATAVIASEHAPAWWAMVLVIATEATIFALLLSSYVYLGFATGGGWPPAGIKRPELALPLAGTALLLGGSIPIVWAERAIRSGRGGPLRVGLAIALVASVGFLAIQAAEYARKDFTPQTSAYGSMFFIITGFHGLHVLVAVLMNATLQWRAARGHFTATGYLAIQVVGLYWHFVGAVWVFILGLLYLAPYVVRGSG